MQADPSGRNPYGVSTAPRFWTNVHRGLGYQFLMIYLLLMSQMVPRLWRFEVSFDERIWTHAMLGAFVGVTLVTKILIIRRFRQFGHRLPWFGGAICAATLLLLALVLPSAWRLQSPLGMPSAKSMPLEIAGRSLIVTKCTQCHGAGVILHEPRSLRGWERKIEKMRARSVQDPTRIAVSPQDAEAISRYLLVIRGEVEGAEPDEDAGHRRRRGRERRTIP